MKSLYRCQKTRVTATCAEYTKPHCVEANIATLDIDQLLTTWCRRRDSNSHGFRHRPLKTACLPIPPRRQSFRRNTDQLSVNYRTSRSGVRRFSNYFGISLVFESASAAGLSGDGTGTSAAGAFAGAVAGVVDAGCVPITPLDVPLCA